MSQRIVNVLVTSFPGLGLPPTLCLPLSTSSTVSDLSDALQSKLPATSQNLILTTVSNKQIPQQSSLPLSSYFADGDSSDILPLRLSACLCGGKGGFGSQLRAAGGRMSSRKKRSQGENNGSSRNLDGRRLRTVTEAKALAEYLSIKPEMERREKEERRKRWEQIVEAAEKKEEEIKSGGRARLDGKWVEDKEEAEERTREAVLAALKAGDIKDVLVSRESDASDSGSMEDESEGEDTIPAQAEASNSKAVQKETSRSFFGWDDDADDSSEDEDDETEIDAAMTETLPADQKGKCKASAV